MNDITQGWPEPDQPEQIRNTMLKWCQKYQNITPQAYNEQVDGLLTRASMGVKCFQVALPGWLLKVASRDKTPQEQYSDTETFCQSVIGSLKTGYALDVSEIENGTMLTMFDIVKMRHQFVIDGNIARAIMESTDALFVPD